MSLGTWPVLLLDTAQYQGSTSDHFNGRLPRKNCRCWPVVAFSITCLFICPPPTSTYNSHTLQLFNVQTTMAGRRRYKIARVTPRLGNGPRFGTCSVFLHNIRQMFSIQHHLHWFKRTKFEGTQKPEEKMWINWKWCNSVKRCNR